MSANLTAAFLAALSGLFLSIIGVTFRWGQSKGVVPLHIATCMGIFGAIFFGFKADWSLMRELPRFIYIIAIANGLGQIVAMELTKHSLRRGPLSPVWCAMNLTFLLVTLYAAFMFGEKITLTQYLAIGAGFISVAFASTIGGGTQEKIVVSLHDKIIYGLMLVLILITNSIIFIAIKDLSTRIIPGTELTWLGKYTANIYFIFYTVLAFSTGAVVVAQKSRPTAWKYLFGLGLLAGIGSIGGMFLLSLCARYPAAIVFTVNGMIIILGGALASVAFFGEKAGRAWYGTIGFGIAAVFLANLDKFF